MCATSMDEAHHRRTGSGIGASVSVSAEMCLSMSNKAVIASTPNKQALINVLAEDMVKETSVLSMHKGMMTIE